MKHKQIPWLELGRSNGKQPGRALTFRKFPEKMDIGSKKMYLQEVCEGGQKNQGHVTFPRKSRAVVGDIRKNGQNFGDLNFHKI